MSRLLRFLTDTVDGDGGRAMIGWGGVAAFGSRRAGLHLSLWARGSWVDDELAVINGYGEG